MMMSFRRTLLLLSICFSASCAGDGWTWRSFAPSPTGSLQIWKVGWDRGRFAAKSPTGKPRWAWAMDVSSQTGWIGVIQVIAVLEDETGVVSADTLTRHLGLAPGGGWTTLVSRGTLEGPGHPKNFRPRFTIWVGAGCSREATPQNPTGCYDTGRMTVDLKSRR